MAHRFTDSNKWKDDWFGSLKNDDRIIWLYIIDNCSFAGIWKKDFRSLNFDCNVKIDESYLNELFGDRIINLGKSFFIPKFLKFQYPKGLNGSSRINQSIREHLERNDLLLKVNELYGDRFLEVPKEINNPLITPSNPIDNPYLTPSKEIDKPLEGLKYKDKDKDKELGGVGEKNSLEGELIVPRIIQAFVKTHPSYPTDQDDKPAAWSLARKIGSLIGLKKQSEVIDNPDKIILKWQEIIDFTKSHKWFSNRSLPQLDKEWKGLIQDFTNPLKTAQNQNGKQSEYSGLSKREQLEWEELNSQSGITLRKDLPAKH